MSDIAKYKGKADEKDIDTIDFSPDIVGAVKDEMLNSVATAIASAAAYVILKSWSNKRR